LQKNLLSTSSGFKNKIYTLKMDATGFSQKTEASVQDVNIYLPPNDVIS
jgi:hypothetical protein